jgi:valyl-tRNA synthetase
MSKTKGNTVDPLETVDEIGADALRFALVSGSAPGSDQRLTRAKLDGGRNFTNKLWNAARFVLAQPAGADSPRAGSRPGRALDRLAPGGGDRAGHAPARRARPGRLRRDRVRGRVERLLRLVPRDGEGRPATRGASDAERAATWRARPTAWPTLLRLLHPLMPFVTEEIWQALAEAMPAATGGEPLLVRAAWPASTSPATPRRTGVRATSPRWCAACGTCAPRLGTRPGPGRRW